MQLIVRIFVGVGLLWLLYYATSVTRQTAADPNAPQEQATADQIVNKCISDWHACLDNADMINNNTEAKRGHYECKNHANDVSKYGNPGWSWVPFGKYLRA
jgi:hypothetical protein